MRLTPFLGLGCLSLRSNRTRDYGGMKINGKFGNHADRPGTVYLRAETPCNPGRRSSHCLLRRRPWRACCLLHGFGASADSWNRFAKPLTKRYRVIAPDQPGWGASTRIETASYGYPAQIERLHQFLSALGLKRVHLVGHSMGGFIASAYAARYPDEVITTGIDRPARHG